MTTRHDTPSPYDYQNAAKTSTVVNPSILLALIENKQIKSKRYKGETLIDFLRRIGLIP